MSYPGPVKDYRLVRAADAPALEAAVADALLSGFQPFGSLAINPNGTHVFVQPMVRYYDHSEVD